jgi:membrane protease YdiL (CAAX protease family)
MLLPVVWAACAIAGFLYAHQQNIPLLIAAKALPAFLLEATFYYALASDRVRTRIEKLGDSTVATALTAAAIAPYLAVSLAFHAFAWRSFGLLAALAFCAAFWYVFTAKTPCFDVVFLVFIAAVMLTRVFPHIYPSPHPKLPLYALGQAMWVRTGVFVMLAVRRVTGVGFGFWPDRRHWKIGVLYYCLFLACSVEVALLIHFGTPHWPRWGWGKTSFVAVGTFFGILWVVALGEEFFFRGLLQQWIGKWVGNEKAGLLITAILFGAVHLWFRSFPNWRFAIMAALAGVFYGMAFRQTKSIRASMVTHALVVTTWRLFF